MQNHDKESVTMTFICKYYEVLWPEMFFREHLVGSAVIFVAFDGWARNLTMLC
jgi:hypothetical protein